MFILENSQLLEDTIQDKDVLQLYMSLKKNEPINCRNVYIEEILSSNKCIELTQALVDHANESESNKIASPFSDISSSRIHIDLVNKIASNLAISIEDLAALSLINYASLIQLFVIDNFTGPDQRNEPFNYPHVYEKLATLVNYSSLANDGSETYHLINNPWMLRSVQLHLNLLSSIKKPRLLLDLEYLVWKHRFLTVYYIILLEPSETLMSELRKISQHIFDHHILNTIKDNNTQLVRFDVICLCCELIQTALLRGDHTFCRRVLEYCFEQSGVSIEHTGMLGKRTKFQQNNIAQLVIKVSKASDGTVLSDSHPTALPKDVELVDDTLLPEIAFVGDDKDIQLTEKEPLLEQAQVLLLSKLEVALKIEVTEESLQDELTLAYLRSIIKFANIWTVKFKALCMRSLVEKKFSRKVERSLLQMEELIKTIKNPTSEFDGESNLRLKYFYSVLPLSNWTLHKQLGDISLSLGLVKNALDMYASIEYWEGMISCYHALGQNNKAQELIKQELSKQETPYLYCLLGDVTEDISYYEKSWILSNKRFARAKKSIGTYFYVRKEYNEAINNYEEALKANPSNVSILSLLAYSCLITERYELAAKYYRNITYFDDSNFLAWNNLSKAYIRMNQMERAWRTLKEAIKCNYDEWKIWENFIYVAMEIGAVDDVILAWHRILDIKSSHKDDKTLHLMTQALINKELTDDIKDDYKKILRDSLKLLARLNATSECSPRLWLCYYKLLLKEFQLFKLEAGDKMDELELESRLTKMLNALQRSTPSSLIANSDWYKSKETIVLILNSYLELTDCYALAAKLFGRRKEFKRQWQSFKLSVNNTLTILRKHGYN